MTGSRPCDDTRVDHRVVRAVGPTVRIVVSRRADGDFHRTEVPIRELDARRHRLVDLPWTMLTERHGVGVVHVRRPGEHDGADGDVAITDADGAALGCWVGDCAPVVLVGRDRTLATVHAGWRGLAAGVLDVAVAAFDEPLLEAYLGPCIGPCCYEFGEDDLAAVASGVGADPAAVRGVTRWGTPALDVPAAVAAACRRIGVPLTVDAPCTGCTFDGFSHRARGDAERHVVVAWQGSAP